MASFSSPGIGSGLDVNSLMTSLMELERQPIKALDKKEAKVQAKISAIGLLKSSLAGLQSAAAALATPAQVSPIKTTVANPSVLTATAGSTAAASTYDVEVQQLAQSQKLLTGGFADTNSAIGTVGGKITFEFGTYGAGPSFTADPGKPAKSITIDVSNNSLTGLRDAINAANMGVTAAIINDGSPLGYHLSFTSTETGENRAMKVSVDDASLNAFTYDPTGGTSNMSQTVAAQNAVIKVDGTTINKSSNTITDAIDGVTLNLATTTAPGVTTRVTLSRDNTAVQTAIQNFVKAYNDTNKAITDATAYDPATGKSGTLNGDSTVRMAQYDIRTILTSPVSGAPNGSSMLADIGINFQRDGTLSIDNAKLTAALADPAKDISALFASNGSINGYAAQINDSIGRTLSPFGSFAASVTGLNSTISAIGKQRAALESRMVGIEKRYRAQFTALDVSIAGMNKTSSFLTQQLKNLSSMVTPNN
ncbi:MAG: flagellar filament capping protein FliD [Sterolibacterium sp.]|nr:flagellar filament capping protein FliD [Sterolibacterium sp.]MBP9798900.1 flagellar filament capping protein FliD [Sterolibacterium sp.]